jgi:TonB family protein
MNTRTIKTSTTQTWIVVVFLLACAPCGAETVPTQQSIEAKLRSGPFLMLRGRWDGGKPIFDSQGNLVGTEAKTLFSLSAVVVTQVQLTDTQLEIRGRRAGLEFVYKEPLDLRMTDITSGMKMGVQPYEKKEGQEIDIARDAQHPEMLDAAVDKVFSVGIDRSLAAAAPVYWQAILMHYLPPKQPMPHGPLPGDFPGGGVRNPILRYAPDPKFSSAAQAVGLSGVSVVGLIVDAKGTPQEVRIVRPLGMGLDEFAVANVLQYRFEPAMYRRRAVPVEINIEVNFRP